MLRIDAINTYQPFSPADANVKINGCSMNVNGLGNINVWESAHNVYQKIEEAKAKWAEMLKGDADKIHYPDLRDNPFDGKTK